MRQTWLGVCVVGLAAATASAAGETNDPGTPGASSPVEIVRASLNLQPGDVAAMRAAANAPARYAQRIGSHEFSGELLVRPRGEIRGVSSAPADRLRRAFDRVSPLVVKKSRLTEQYVVRVPAGMNENQLSAMLMATGDYEYAEPNWLLYPADTVPNDPQYASSWQHTRLQSADAWDLLTGSPDIIVGVCDTGVDLDHPDLQASLVSGYNSRSNTAQADGGDVEDINGHGTFVAGCSAAIGNNATGVVGVGWNFKIMPIRVTNNSNGTANPYDLQEGALWAVANGAKIANVSFSGGVSSSNEAAGQEIKAMGGLMFWAAGNDGSLLPDVPRPGYVIVGSTTASDNLSGFSNYGPPVDVVAPGSQVRSTRRGGSYGNGSGTSYASPIAAGVGAMIFAARPELHPTDVQEILALAADDLGAPGEDDTFGAGRVNTLNSVLIAQSWVPRIPLPIDDAFDSLAIDADVWISVNGAEVLDHAGSGALNLDANDTIESAGLFGGDAAGQTIVLTMTVRQQGVDAGETLEVEYLDAADTWRTARSVSAADAADAFNVEFVFDDADVRNGMKIRVRALGSDADDDWFIDDVFVGVPVAQISIPFADRFDSSELFPTRWDPASTAGIDSGAMRLEPGQSALTLALPAAVFPDTLYLNFRADDSDAAPGDTLSVEYRDTLGSFRTIDLLTSDAAGGSEARTVELPLLAYHNAMALRFTSNAGAWRVDDLLLGFEPVADCPADLAEPFGALDFSDVLAFLSAFGSAEPAADLAPPFGSWDFSDVLAFLSAFGAGCP